jgi:serine/threonine protein kinase
MEDERLIRLAQDHGYITAGQVAKAREEQRQLADRGVERSVWFLLQDLGFINDAQVKDLRKYVSSTQVRALEVSGYVLQGRLGSGGMGDVFRAADAAGHIAAVKLLSTRLMRSDEHIRRFHREARASLRLKHPHIAQSLASGEIDGQCYLIMELVAGPSLKQRLVDSGPMPPHEALVLLWQMGEALRYAWANGVLHRDVKPANIILAPPRPDVDEPFCAKLCDFGLAKIDDKAGDDMSHGGLTGTGLALGTPHYMAPEQASGEHDLDQRADIYSLGASVFHALIGQTMYSGRSSTVIMYKQVTEDVDLSPLREHGADQPLIDLLARMLDRRRDRRIATWDEVLRLAEDLGGISLRTQRRQLAPDIRPTASTATVPATAPVASEPTHHTDTLTTPVRGPWRVLIGALLAVLALAAGAAIALSGDITIHVTPSTLATVLASADARHPLLELAPGDYRGPWRFGVSHSGLTIQAGGPGVRLLPGDQDAATLRMEPGLKDLHLIGLTIIGHDRPGAPALEILAGADASGERITLRNGADIAGGNLALRDSALQGSIALGDRGHADFSSCDLVGNLRLADSHAVLRHCTITSQDPSLPALFCAGGSLTLDASGLTAPSDAPAVMRLADGAVVRLNDVRLAGGRTGLIADRISLERITGLTITAQDCGIRWTGLRPPEWAWTGIIITAPIPTVGVTLPPVRSTTP